MHRNGPLIFIVLVIVLFVGGVYFAQKDIAVSKAGDQAVKAYIQEQNIKAAEQRKNAQSFTFAIQGKEFLRFGRDGKFYVKGKAVANDVEVFESFKKWVNQGCK